MSFLPGDILNTQCNCILAPGVAQGWQVLSVEEVGLLRVIVELRRARGQLGTPAHRASSWAEQLPGPRAHGELQPWHWALARRETRGQAELSSSSRHKTETKTPFDTQQLASSIRREFMRWGGGVQRAGIQLQCHYWQLLFHPTQREREKPISIIYIWYGLVSSLTQF